MILQYEREYYDDYNFEYKVYGIFAPNLYIGTYSETLSVKNSSGG